MAKHYIDILNIAKESVDAQKLLHYRAPHAAKLVIMVFTAIWIVSICITAVLTCSCDYVVNSTTISIIITCSQYSFVFDYEIFSCAVQ